MGLIKWNTTQKQTEFCKEVNGNIYNVIGI